MKKFKEFKSLHQKDEILYIGNVWDVQSALMFEKMKYKAIGTSSSAIANSLGYEDGENMSFEELFTVVKSIIKKVSIPLSVDLESGYGKDTDTIIKNIISLVDIGVVGINIEDSIVKNDNRTIVDSHEFSQTIKNIKTYIVKNNINIFLNIRTDFYIMGLKNPLDETLKRIKLYEDAGADGIFIPCITNIEDIKKVVNITSLAINVMAIPNLPSFSELQNNGIKRVSQGPFLYNDMMKKLQKTINNIEKNNSFESLFV